MVENNIGSITDKGTTDLSDFIFSGLTRASNMDMKRGLQQQDSANTGLFPVGALTCRS